MANTLRFFWNGIKGTDGKLQKCSYSTGTYTEASSIPAGTITIYGKYYKRFSSDVKAVFEVKNDTDSQSDYVVDDTIRVTPSHPMFSLVKAAFDKSKTHYDQRSTKLAEKRAIKTADADSVDLADLQRAWTIAALTIQGVSIGDIYENGRHRRAEVVDFIENRSMVTGEVVGYRVVAKSTNTMVINTFEECFTTVLKNRIKKTGE